MASSRTRALQLVAKMRQRELEQEAAALGRLRIGIDSLAAEAEALQAELQAQGAFRSLEAAVHMPGYLRAVRGEQTRIARDVDRLKREEQALEASVRERFRERKVFETVLEQVRAEELDAILRAETAELEAFALMRHGMAVARRLRKGEGEPTV